PLPSFRPARLRRARRPDRGAIVPFVLRESSRAAAGRNAAGQELGRTPARIGYRHAVDTEPGAGVCIRPGGAVDRLVPGWQRDDAAARPQPRAVVQAFARSPWRPAGYSMDHDPVLPPGSGRAEGAVCRRLADRPG